jgi:hypothetical protein
VNIKNKDEENNILDYFDLLMAIAEDKDQKNKFISQVYFIFPHFNLLFFDKSCQIIDHNVAHSIEFIHNLFLVTLSVLGNNVHKYTAKIPRHIIKYS